MKLRVKRKILAFFFALLLTFNPASVGIALSETEEPSEPVIEETADTSNQAEAESSQKSSITNENEATIENNVEVEANTGENEIVPEEDGVEESSPDTQEGENPEGEEVIPTPVPTPSEEEGLTSGDGGFEEGDLGDAGENEELLTPTPSSAEVLEEEVEGETDEGADGEGAQAVNGLTPEDSENTATASAEETVEIINENEAEVENDVSDEAQTGENESGGDGATILTGEATTEADLVNVVNTNLVGNDFWQAIINLFEDSQENIDLSEIEGLENFDPELISVFAQNLETGDGSVNLALASLLSLLSVYNENIATLTNNVDLLASSGSNQVVGDNGEIITGDAAAYLNLFNMVNTNLIGESWFFGLINLFGDLEGDVILPYELQFLGEDAIDTYEEYLTLAANLNNGSESENKAEAETEITLEISNFNEANLKNNISVEANTGRNGIVGDGQIDTGDANASANVFNWVNTNIVGSRWLLLAINNFGNWFGSLNGWWGNTFSIGKTTFAWVKLPPSGDDSQAMVGSVNTGAGEGSENQALATMVQTTTIENRNLATVENNLNVVADTGNNQIEGESASIETGNAQASTNIFNFINTNIIGNHWYFGVVNVFSNFWGDILFPRPNLSVVKSADKESVFPGDEVAFTISYENTGRLWAKDVVITDYLPSELHFVSASNGGVYQDGQVKWEVGKVWPGQGGSLTLVVQVDSEIADGTQLMNSVQVSTSTNEPDQENNSSSAGVAIGGISDSGSDDGVSSSSLGVGDSLVCHDPVPGGAPRLIEAIPGENRVTLVWEKASDPVNYYLIAYGLSSGDYIYGNPNVGGSETTSYTVDNLSGGTTYYFVVRAGNGCAPGPFSNELAATPYGSALEGMPVGFYPGVLGVQATKGELGEALAAEGEPWDEVAGAETKWFSWWWLLLALLLMGALRAYFRLRRPL